MKRRSQGRTSVAKEPAPAPLPIPPLPSPPATLKRELTGGGQQCDDTDNPAKRQRVDSPPPNSMESGDQTLVQEEAEEVNTRAVTYPRLGPLATPANPGLKPHASPKLTSSHSHSKALPALTRHERFWYDDGSVVLQVRRVLFRLHNSLLSVQSSYFRDLFANQDRPAEDYDAGSGVLVPLYVLSLKGLRLFDFEKLLEILENPHMITRNMERLPLRNLNAIARASYILSFKNTHAWVKDELLEYWSSDLDDIKSQPENCFTAAMFALQTSKDAHVPEIRKGAFYELLRMPNMGQSDEDALQLVHADYNILTRARQYCSRVWMDVLLKPPPRSNACKEQEKEERASSCAARKDAYLCPKWLKLVGAEDLSKYSIDPVAGFRALQKVDLPGEDEGGFCYECRCSWVNLWRDKICQFWDGLDEVLGLPQEADKEDETVEVVG